MAFYKYTKGYSYILLSGTVFLSVLATSRVDAQPPDIGKTIQDQRALGNMGIIELYTTNCQFSFNQEAARLFARPKVNYSRIPQSAGRGQARMATVFNVILPDTASIGREIHEMGKDSASLAGASEFRYSPCTLPTPPAPPAIVCQELYHVVEEKPSFPGCEEITDAGERRQCSNQRLLEFFYSQFNYPKDACVEGTVVVSFIVTRAGQMENPQLLRDIGGAGEETLRVLQLMIDQDIRWMPGRQRGRPVDVLMTMPLRICLGRQAEVEVEVQHSSGILTTQAINVLQLFPNPASDHLNIRFQAATSPMQIGIYNLSGQELLHREYEADEGLFETEIGLSGLPSGPYLLILEQAGQRFPQQFIRE